uniref:Uncharacterized protein n=1 Tax=Utricularia reniformis TaxID=192314 RepID=A0A1Y0B4H5_9LAMI|nr:hypothetical protein AEK19_MT2210 [Utricularia reniformis]ART32355.1 hypothetical protein AEK19_MT2210 [Utricularia reniformis]
MLAQQPKSLFLSYWLFQLQLVGWGIPIHSLTIQLVRLEAVQGNWELRGLPFPSFHQEPSSVCLSVVSTTVDVHS